ncbi:MAG: site-specific DNA-methyltransferase [Desulfurococcaceae archaeon]
MVVLGNAFDVLKHMPKDAVDMVITDPPYGLTRLEWDSGVDINVLVPELVRVSKGAVVITTKEPFTSDVVQAGRRWFKHDVIWEKSNVTRFLDAKRRVLSAHENILVFYKRRPTYNPQFTWGRPYRCHQGSSTQIYRDMRTVLTVSDGRRYPRSVLRISSKDSVKKYMPTQKPAALFEGFVLTFTNEGDLVFDPFLGSGTTAVVCKRLNRRCFGVEIDRDRYDYAVRRVNEGRG